MVIDGHGMEFIGDIITTYNTSVLQHVTNTPTINELNVDMQGSSNLILSLRSV